MFNTIKLLFIFIFIFFIGLFFILSSGVNIEKFSFASINVSKLYIKLDKKLIVQIEELVLPATSTTQNSTNDIKKHIQYIPWLLTVFEQIDIESLKIKNNEFTITVDKSIFYIDNKLINLAAKPVVADNSVTLNLYSLLLKDHDAFLDGTLKANLENDDILFTGSVLYKNQELTLSAQGHEDTIDFVLKSNKEFENIHFVKDFVQLHHTIEEWMYDNVTGIMHLEYLQGQLNRNTFMPILESLDGRATIENAKIRFHKDVDTVNTPLLTVSFKNDNLYFDLEKPMYKDISIDGSNVVIHALSGKEEPSNIVINLNTQHHLNQDILDILKAYHITLPIIQLDGLTQSQLAIQVYFKEHKLITKGVFEAKESNFSLNGFNFLAKNALVELDNSHVKIIDSNVEVKDLFDAKLNLDIDTATHLAKGKAEVKNFNVQAQENNLIHIDAINTDVLIDYTRFTQIALPQLFTQISVLKEFTNINITNLNFVHTYSKLLQELKINEGTLDINLHNINNIDFRANLSNLDFPIQDKNGLKVDKMNIQGQINNNKISINSLDETIKIRIANNKNLIQLKNIDILNQENTLLKEENKTVLQIKAENSNIILNEKQKLLADSYTLNLNKNTMNLNLTQNSGILNYKKEANNTINFETKNMSDEFMNNLLGIEHFFTDGTFDLTAKGTTKLLNGNAIIKNSKVKQLALLNNLITFVNTTPAIINPLLALPTIFGMANNKGFNLAGYRIVEGDLDFTYSLQNELFYINSLNTTGNMADFKANGIIDLNKKELESDVVIIFLKDYTKIIDYVPVFNYLFLGDDKNISTQVKIFGSLDNPEIQTNLTQEAAGASLNFVKRIFNLPSKGLELLTPSK